MRAVGARRTATRRPVRRRASTPRPRRPSARPAASPRPGRSRRRSVTPSPKARGCAPSSRWIVDAGASHSSSSRLAARPVGAASATVLSGPFGQRHQRRHGAALARPRPAGDHADARCAAPRAPQNAAPSSSPCDLRRGRRSGPIGFGRRHQPGDAVGHGILGLHVASQTERRAVGAGHDRPAAQRCLDRGAERRPALSWPVRGSTSPPATRVCPSRAWPASTCATSARARRASSRLTPGIATRATRSASASADAPHAEQPPRVIAQQPRRRRPELVHHPPGQPRGHVRRAPACAVTSYTGSAPMNDDSNRSARAGPTFGSSRSRVAVTSCGPSMPDSASAPARVPPSPGHSPAAQNAREDRVATLMPRGGCDRVSATFLGVVRRRRGHVVQCGADLLAAGPAPREASAAVS